MRTRSENCCQFSRSPSAIAGSGSDEGSAPLMLIPPRPSLPEFIARISAACGGGGGMSASIARTNSRFVFDTKRLVEAFLKSDGRRSACR